MSLLLSRLRLGKPALLRRSSSLLRILCNGFSSSLKQTPPCLILVAYPCGRLIFSNANERCFAGIDKRVPMELVYNCLDDGETVTIGASHGWVATLEDGILCLQDDLNPHALVTNPKRIALPPLVALPHCQTEIVTNVAMSSSSPEDEDCVVAAKFLGPQLSFCRPAAQSEWTNVRIENPCFDSSRVMYSKKDDVFRIPGSGGHLIGSWDFRNDIKKPKLQSLRFQNLPKLTKAKRELLASCCTSQHLVESATGETFLVKWYKKTARIIDGIAKMKTKALMVFKLDEEEGNAVYTNDIGDLCIFLSYSEPLCLPASSFPGMYRNCVQLLDADEGATVFLEDSSIISGNYPFRVPYSISPQNIA